MGTFLSLLLFFLLLLNYCDMSEAMILSQDEENLLLDLLKYLRVDNCIFTGKYYTATNFKKISSSKIYTRFKLEFNLFNYLFKARYYEDQKTMIVYKEEDLELINRFFDIIRKKKAFSIINNFTWLMLINESDLASANNSFFYAIPYDCRFIIAYHNNFTNYRLLRVYGSETGRFFTNYGKWDNELGLSVLTETKYPGKVNMNQTKFTGVTLICEEDRQRPLNKDNNDRTIISECSTANFFRDIIRSMNFRYEEIQMNANTTIRSYDAIAEEVNIVEANIYRNFIKYLPSCDFIMIIKYPETKDATDYYIRPFNKNLWAAVIIMIIVGGLLFIIIHYVEIFVIKNRRTVTINVTDYISVVCESFCNQAYCADIKAYLSVKTVKLPFRNLKEFSENDEYKIFIHDSGFTYYYFANGNGSIRSRILDNNRIEYYKNFSDLQRLCSNEKLALPYYSDTTLPEDIACRLYRIPQPITKIFKSIILAENTPFSRILNHVFLQAREAGFAERESRIKKSSMKKFFLSSEDDFQTVSINQLSHVISFIGIGILFGFIFLVFELAIKIFIVSRRKRKQEIYKKLGFTSF